MAAACEDSGSAAGGHLLHTRLLQTFRHISCLFTSKPPQVAALFARKTRLPNSGGQPAGLVWPTGRRHVAAAGGGGGGCFIHE